MENGDYSTDKQEDNCLLTCILKMAISLDGSLLAPNAREIAENLCTALLLQFQLMEQSKCMFGVLGGASRLFFNLSPDECAEIFSLTALICNVHYEGTVHSGN